MKKKDVEKKVCYAIYVNYFSVILNNILGTLL